METLPAWFVVVMGMGTVFVGLFLIILLCKLLSFAFTGKKETTEKADLPAAETDIPAHQKNRILAIASAAIAVDCGKNPAAIRILSIKRVK